MGVGECKYCTSSSQQCSSFGIRDGRPLIARRHCPSLSMCPYFLRVRLPSPYSCSPGRGIECKQTRYYHFWTFESCWVKIAPRLQIEFVWIVLCMKTPSGALYLHPNRYIKNNFQETLKKVLVLANPHLTVYTVGQHSEACLIYGQSIGVMMTRWRAKGVTCMRDPLCIYVPTKAI